MAHVCPDSHCLEDSWNTSRFQITGWMRNVGYVNSRVDKSGVLSQERNMGMVS